MAYKANGKICYKCGTEMEMRDLFCPNCGERCEAQAAPEPAPVPEYDMGVEPLNSPKSKTDIKRTVLGNVIPVVCMIIGVIMIIVGLNVNVPSGYISSYDVIEYVGGDAYNYIMEASIKGGKIAAAGISKCIFISVGLLIVCISALKIKVVKSVRGE